MGQTTAPRQVSPKPPPVSSRTLTPSYTWLREIPRGCGVSEASAHLQRIMVLGTRLWQVLAQQWQGPMVYTVASEYGERMLRIKVQNIVNCVTSLRLWKRRLWTDTLPGGVLAIHRQHDCQRMLLPGRLFIETTSRASSTAQEGRGRVRI